LIRRIVRSIQKQERQAHPVDRLVVGLGNTGSKYAATRHNIGFVIVAELASRLDAQTGRNRFEAEIREASIDGMRVALACPTTMMNNSGYAVTQLCRWYKLKPEHVLIVYDELDLPFGTIRMRPRGGAGGHNGVRSVIDQLGTQEFPRLRVGVGRPTSGSTVSYVLSRFREEEQPFVKDIVALSSDAVIHWLKHGTESAMNAFNRESVVVRAAQP
jgi:peptidyl-tRNA hydrolase, PTH1 family